MTLSKTQLAQDRNARGKAVPFRGSIWGFNYFDGAEKSLSRQTFDLANSGPSDVSTLVGGYGVVSVTPLQLNPIRILQPHYGQIISCYLDFSITFNSADNGMQCWIAIGNFTSGAPNWTVNTSYTTAYITQSWTQINGKSTPLTVSGGSIAPNTLNLTPALYPSTSSSFVPEAFVLLIYFSRTPTASGFNLNYLNVHASVQGIM